jgi:hypothetical protein
MSYEDAVQGEPWTFGFPGTRATEYVIKRGLEVISDLTPNEMSARHLRGF